MELITELSVGRARLLSPVSARANKGQNSRIKYEDQRGCKELFAFTGKRVSVNSLRSSYVSYMVHQAMVKGKLLSVKEKNKIAEKMRSSRKYFDESYTKRFEDMAELAALYGL